MKMRKRNGKRFLLPFGALLGGLYLVMGGTGDTGVPPQQLLPDGSEALVHEQEARVIRRAVIRDIGLELDWGTTDPDGSEWSIQGRTIQEGPGIVAPPAVRGHQRSPLQQQDERASGLFPGLAQEQTPSGWGWLADQVMVEPTAGAETVPPPAATPGPVGRLRDDQDGLRARRWFDD